MNRRIVLLTIGILSLVFFGQVQGTIIHQSALLGTTGQGGGVSLYSNQFLGSRFTISGAAVNVESIGGHMYNFSGSLFGAIVSLSGPNALPSGNPFDLTTLASTNFTGPFPSADILTPLSVTLSPGDYAVIFGSGQFGASGSGAMPNNNTDLPGASYFFWTGYNWQNGGFTKARFVVEGTVIPEPTTFLLFGMGLLGIVAYGWRRKRQ